MGLQELIHSKYGSVSERDVATVETPAGRGATHDVATLAANVTWTREYTNNFQNYLGLNIIRHTGIYQWTGDLNGRLINSPRALNNSTWAVSGITVQSTSTGWDWYNPGQGGTGQGRTSASFLSGIPTPWGGIGQTTNSNILVLVNGYGGAARVS